ncbi:MAG: hypothetical protein Q9201_000943 [Fulgogasparrea decipioides]
MVRPTRPNSGPGTSDGPEDEDQQEAKGREVSHLQQSFELIKSFSSEAWTYRLPLSIFVTHELAMGIRDIAEQWMSKRYTWPIRKIGYILAAQTLLSAVIFASLPKIGTYLARKRAISTAVKDLFLVKYTLAAAVIGTMMIAFAWSRELLLCGLAVFAFGVGFHDALKSYVTAQLQDAAHISRLYMWISLLEVVANMVNGPFWALIYTLALHIGGLGLGLPFLICSGVFAGTLLLVKLLG